jgi:Tfp pilus assembly protein PilF
VGCISAGATKKDYADLHFRVGSSQLEKGNFPEALKELLQAESYETKEPLIYNNLGLAYFMLERYEQSEVNFRKALALDKTFTDSRNNLSRVLIERGKYKEAREQIKIVLEDLTYTQPGKVFINLGLSYFKEQKYSEAKDAFLKAVSYDRESCLAQNYYGRSLLEMKDSEKAIQALDKASGYCLKVNYDEPIYFSAIAYYRMGDRIKAQARLETLVQKNSPFKDKAESMLDILRK